MPKFVQVITMSKKTEGKDDDPKLLNLYNLVISSTVPISNTFLGFLKSLITTWWGVNVTVLPSPEWVMW